VTAPDVTLAPTTVPVAETFQSFQGEGPSLGVPAHFIRFGLCNLTCKWCDSGWTWDRTRYDVAKECPPRTLNSLLGEIVAAALPLAVFTGGEPLIHHKALGNLLHRLRDSRLQGGLSKDHQIEIETNGTLIPSFPSDLVTRFNVSPKLENSGVSLRKRINGEALRWLAQTSRAIFKFVVCDLADLEEIDRYVALFDLPRDRIYLMPEGVSVADNNTHLQAVAEAALARRYRLTTRLHVAIWGNKRGV
jgi:organic radical activating enzyme